MQQDLADTDDDYSECSSQASSDLSSWEDDVEQLPSSSLAPHALSLTASSPSPAAAQPLSFDVAPCLQLQAAAPLQQYALGHHWQHHHQAAGVACTPSTAGLARACLAQRGTSCAHSSTVVVEESTVVCETLLMLAGLPSRIFSTGGSCVRVCADVAVASVSPAACTSWLQSWAQVGSMCRRCEAVMLTDYEVASPVVQVHASCLFLLPPPFTSLIQSSGFCRLPA